MTITGDTGSGKTTLAATLIQARQHTLSLRSKADPAPLPGKRIRSAKAFRDSDENRLVLDPAYERQFREFALALEYVWQQGGWAVYLDELFYLSQLKLGKFVDRLLTQGRSKGLTVISGMQRPVSVTRFAMSQSTHLIAFSAEGRDLKTLAEAGSDSWADAVAGLSRYQCAWYYRPERRIWTGYVQDLVKD